MHINMCFTKTSLRETNLTLPPTNSKWCEKNEIDMLKSVINKQINSINKKRKHIFLKIKTYYARYY